MFLPGRECITHLQMWALERQKVSRPLSLSKLKNSSEQSASSGLFMSQRTSFTEEISAEFANPTEICLAISAGVVSHLFPSFTFPPSRIVTLIKFTAEQHYCSPSYAKYISASIVFTWSDRVAETESPRAASLGTPRRAWYASRWRLRDKPRPWDVHPPSLDLEEHRKWRKAKGWFLKRRMRADGSILWHHFTKVFSI